MRPGAQQVSVEIDADLHAVQVRAVSRSRCLTDHLRENLSIQIGHGGQIGRSFDLRAASIGKEMLVAKAVDVLAALAVEEVEWHLAIVLLVVVDLPVAWPVHLARLTVGGALLANCGDSLFDG